MTNATRKNLLISVSAAIIMIIGMFAGNKFTKEQRGVKTGFPLWFGQKEKVDEVLSIIQKNYVDPVNTDTLEKYAITDILNHLDPHSIYLPPVDAQLQNETLEGNFEGVGIEYYILNDSLLVTNVREDGPAEKAGLKKGDFIVKINNDDIIGKNLIADKVIGKLRGRRGTSVSVSVFRNGEKNLKELTITRDKIIISSIDAAYLITPEVGYIKLGKFGAKTDVDFKAELNKLKAAGMKKLILDLRGNGGGYLNAATSLADQFLDNDKLIVYTQGLHEPRTDYFATGEGLFEKGDLKILIDEGTASASEIVAGAVQDLGRGTIIGRRSYGKGLVQEQFNFGDGSAMNLTVARYYTPSGRSIQKSYKRGVKEYRAEINERYVRGEMSSLDSTLADTLLNVADKKFKTNNGKTVYGGGGILPDVFVAIDTTGYSKTYREIMSKSLLSDYVYKKLINSVKIANYANAADFTDKFNVDDLLLSDFLKFCSSKIKNISELDSSKSKELLRKQMKALAAQYFFNDEGFYRVQNTFDPEVSAALK